MTRQDDVAPASDIQPFTTAPLLTPTLDEAAGQSLHQEINARRARVENAELLQHLRSL